MLQWLVVIGTSYLSLFSGSDIRNDPRVLLLVAMLMSSGIVLQRLPERVFQLVKFNFSFLVMGFLDASKAETGETQQLETPVALNWLIQEVAREEALEMLSNGITLNLELDPNLPEILGDVLQIERVLWNLLSNAIKFTPRNGRIEVTTASAEGQVRVMIRDTGVGIATEDLPLLFSEYRRLKGSGSTEGSGLGLYIVKNIVKSHGGTVNVESELGKGTTFVLTFPIAAKLAPVTDAQIKLAS